MSVPSRPEPRPPRSERVAVAVIPARLASQRLPRKMLLAETGLPLFAHTARNAASSGAFARVVVATDSEEIARAARREGLEAVMTRPDHKSGTDRANEAIQALGAERVGVVVSVQGDEPEIDPGDLRRLVGAFEDSRVEVATLCGPLASPEEAQRPQVVKVVRDSRGDALYFSRSVVPFRPADPSEAYARMEAREWLASVRRHVGVYAYTPDALARFCALPPGALEALENLEQLRWLESGGRIRVLEAARAHLGIDTREEYDAFVRRVGRAQVEGRPGAPRPARGTGRG